MVVGQLKGCWITRYILLQWQSALLIPSASLRAGSAKNPDGNGWVDVAVILWILRHYVPQNDSFVEIATFSMEMSF